jgi:2-polyprenyl-6-methoxyphenol hydroxylase-like FAD-dependent oxidoreductase
MVLGLLLARAGVEVSVLEKHGDFLRDFRGDTVHPSTMGLLDDLGLGTQFAALPNSIIERVSLDIGGQPTTLVDFTRLRTRHPYVAMVPQWDLLNLLAKAATDEPTFTLRMNCAATGLLRDGQKVTGLTYLGPDGPGELHADLVVACDGRTSVLRQAAGLTAREYPVPFDVWWFRLPRESGGVYSLIPRTSGDRTAIMIPREGYFQIAYFIPKGADGRLRAQGLAAFRRGLSEVIPEVPNDALTSWDDVKLLDARLNRLHRWYTDGLLCIGDAAHAMSPAGGVGINLAIQDAVAAARLLAGPLRAHRMRPRDLAAVQRRRTLPTVATQSAQRVMHRGIFRQAGVDLQPPAALRTVVDRLPGLSVVPAYFVGIGLRPERAPDFARR